MALWGDALTGHASEPAQLFVTRRFSGVGTSGFGRMCCSLNVGQLVVPVVLGHHPHGLELLEHTCTHMTPDEVSKM